MAIKKRIHIEVDDELLAQIESLAVRLGEKRSTVIRLILRAGVDVLPQRLGLRPEGDKP